jgi:3-deoxy-D-manno-octulosonate 8-phosphate phosphatase (KDO 8-P phosphatase)
MVDLVCGKLLMMFRNFINKKEFSSFIFDVDGVFTDGKFFYSNQGKELKSFGADDHDALIVMKNFLNIQIVTSDKRGFSISSKRVSEDLRFPLELVHSSKRLAWIMENFELSKTIYMGDGICDIEIFKEVGFSICPSNSLAAVKKYADYVTQAPGGDRAIAEACLFVLSRFFSIGLAEFLSYSKLKGEG